MVPRPRRLKAPPPLDSVVICRQLPISSTSASGTVSFSSSHKELHAVCETARSPSSPISTGQAHCAHSRQLQSPMRCGDFCLRCSNRGGLCPRTPATVQMPPRTGGWTSTSPPPEPESAKSCPKRRGAACRPCVGEHRPGPCIGVRLLTCGVCGGFLCKGALRHGRVRAARVDRDKTCGPR